jgi:hypothetical protein
MRTKLFFLILTIFFISETFVYSQADYSDSKDVADKFLQLCIEGKRFKACELYGTDGCQDQMSILLQKMVMKDIPLVNNSCYYKIDSSRVNVTGDSAKYFYSKICKKEKENRKGFLTMFKIDNKWLVEYIWKRDKDL